MTEPRYASREEAEEAAHEWSDAMVGCRIYGHNWIPNTVIRRSGSQSVLSVKQRCSRRCGCFRVQDVSATTGAAISGWHMQYPAKYLSTGIGRIVGEGRDVLRLAALRNLPVLEVDDEEM